MLARIGKDPRFEALTKRMDADIKRMKDESVEVRELFEKTVPAAAAAGEVKVIADLWRRRNPINGIPQELH